MVDTWQSRELPILNAIHGLEETTTRAVSMDALELGTAHEIDSDSLQRGLKALHDGGYVTGHRINRDAAHPIYHLEGIGLTADARRAIGQWPKDGYDALVTRLELRIAAEADPVKKGKLEELLRGIVNAGRDILVDVLSGVARREAGL